MSDKTTILIDTLTKAITLTAQNNRMIDYEVLRGLGIVTAAAIVRLNDMSKEERDYIKELYSNISEAMNE